MGSCIAITLDGVSRDLRRPRTSFDFGPFTMVIILGQGHGMSIKNWKLNEYYQMSDVFKMYKECRKSTQIVAGF